MKTGRLLTAGVVVTLLAAAAPHAAPPQPPAAPTVTHRFAAQMFAAYGSPLVEAPDGTLYGTMSNGGVGDYGAIFKLTPDASGGYAFAVLHPFTGVNGAEPRGLTYHPPTDSLYGVTWYGGANDSVGTVFRLSRAGVLTTLRDFEFDFANPQPLHPTAPLLLASDGNFYGVSQDASGPPGRGSVFRMTPAGDLDVLHIFGIVDGEDPRSPLVEGTDGFLYGTTNVGGANESGTVFRIRKDGTGFATLHHFASGNAWTAQPRGLILDNSSGSDVFYGLTASGGADALGTIFTITPSGTFTTRATFPASSFFSPLGANPIGAMVKGLDGLFYGTTEAGGPVPFGSLGVVFSFDPATNAIAVVHDFNSDFATGIQSRSGLLVAQDGTLLGMTLGGGAHHVGTAYRINLTTSPQTVGKVADVPSLGPAYPQDRLIRASDGFLYGTAYTGGDFNRGAIFRVNADGSVTPLHSFNFIDGGLPGGELVEGSDGYLWGTTQRGGNVQFPGDVGGGTVFRIAKDGSNFTVVHRFENYPVEGAYPLAGLVEGPDGNFYGTTHQNGPLGAGTVFKVTPSGTLTTLHAFGVWSLTRSTLVLGPDGYFYGATREGGSTPTGGTLYKIDSNGNFVQLHEFTDPADGAHPNGLMLGTDGNLYGTAEHGGTTPQHAGTLFRVTPSGSFTVLHRFDTTVDGANPTSVPYEAGDGTLYGTTWFGGPVTPFRTGLGTIYSYDGALVQLLHTFAAPGSDTGSPYAGLTQGTDNLLWGSTTHPATGAIYSFDQGITNKGPVARHQRAFIALDQPVTVNVTASDPDGDPLTFTIVGQPANGSVSGTGPSFVYQPNLGFTGTDFFYVRVNDGTVSSPVAGVMISVGAPNGAPTADDKNVTGDEDTPTPITLTGSDPEGGPLTYTVLTNPQHGILTGTAPALTYTPGGDYHGQDTFLFAVTDNGGLDSVGTVTITINPVNDAPAVADQSFTSTGGAAVPLTLHAIEPDGDGLSYSILTNPANGVLSGTAPNLTYTPNTGFAGTDTFTWRASDGTLDSLVATVTIAATPPNRTPVAHAGGPYIGDLGAGVTFDGSGSSDADTVYGDTLTYQWTIAGVHVLTDGPLAAVPAALIGTLGPGAFTVDLTVTDSTGWGHTAQTTLTVRAPTALFGAMPNPAACGQAIAFNGSASDNRAGRTIANYRWDFGDGSTGSGATASHAYGSYGTYITTLTVTDDLGVAASATSAIDVSQGNLPPVAHPGGPYVAPANAPSLALDGSGSSDPNAACGDSLVSYAWLVNGTLALTGISPSLNAGQIASLGPGTFPVQLTVTDEFGRTAVASTSLTLQAVAVATTTTLQVSPSTVGALQPVTFTATVAPVTGSGVPTGNVEFLNAGTVFGVAALQGGVAVLNTNASVNGGTLSITARYVGAVPFTGSVSAPATLTVRPFAESTLTFLAPATTAQPLGSPFSLSAIVLPLVAGTPVTGSVEFYAGTTLVGTAAVSGGVATTTWTPPAAGTVGLIARYLGSATLASSLSQPALITVFTGAAPAATTTALAAAPSPAALGQPVTFTATLSNNVPAGGLVGFFADGALLGTAVVTNVGGVRRATLTTSGLAVGLRIVSASYGGAPGFAPSNATPIAVVVNP